MRLTETWKWSLAMSSWWTRIILIQGSLLRTCSRTSSKCRRSRILKLKTYSGTFKTFLPRWANKTSQFWVFRELRVRRHLLVNVRPLKVICYQHTALSREVQLNSLQRDKLTCPRENWALMRDGRESRSCLLSIKALIRGIPNIDFNLIYKQIRNNYNYVFAQ